jgi:hypothetical protein
MISDIGEFQNIEAGLNLMVTSGIVNNFDKYKVPIDIIVQGDYGKYMRLLYKTNPDLGIQQICVSANVTPNIKLTQETLFNF